MMRRAILICHLLIFVFALAISAESVSAQGRAGKRSRGAEAQAPARWGTTAYIEKEVFRLLNSEREKHGLKPLVWNDRIAGVARLHSKNMAEQHFFDHRGKDGSLVSNRADKAGIKWLAVGENIVTFFGASDAAQYAADSWMGSPEHRENILTKRWKQTGIGAVVSSDGSYFLTQVFLD
jgi:uncharacterized protein YkwD